MIDGDLVDAIIQLPTDLFYNTGITTYIWILTKGKEMRRAGKVQLIDASKCFVKRRKNIGSKRVDMDDRCIDLIVKAYEAFDNGVYEDDALTVERASPSRSRERRTVRLCRCWTTSTSI